MKLKERVSKPLEVLAFGQESADANDRGKKGNTKQTVHSQEREAFKVCMNMEELSVEQSRLPLQVDAQKQVVLLEAHSLVLENRTSRAHKFEVCYDDAPHPASQNNSGAPRCVNKRA